MEALTFDQSDHVNDIPWVELLGASNEAALSALDPSELKDNQRRAYDIVTWHLDQTIANKDPPPLRLFIQGEGGTGKSKVIQTITQEFAAKGQAHTLLMAAYTGIAASLIDGKTTHIIGAISVGAKDSHKMSPDAKAKLQEIWKPILYLIIDEISMIGKIFWALLSRNISIGKEASPTNWPDMLFRGINIIICGDFHQFPPVASAKSQALYYPTSLEYDTTESQIGWAIYEEFTTVVTLKEQMHVTDLEWLRFLQHLRFGQVEVDNINMLRTLIVTKDLEDGVDFAKEPWQNAALVTPRHGVRRWWNEAAVWKKCRETGHQLYICQATDTIKGKPLTMKEQYFLESRNFTETGQRT